jgi:BlaI family penicillinase repressor
MDVVWSLGDATVKQVQEQLNGDRPMAYNSVLTIMRILRDKGFLESRREGRSDVYTPLVTREQMGSSSLDEAMQRFFGGSARLLVSHMLRREHISRDEMKAIRRQIDECLREEQRG